MAADSGAPGDAPGAGSSSSSFIGGVEIAEPFPACGPAVFTSDELLGCERTPRGCQ